jgi:hypothetical protein
VTYNALVLVLYMHGNFSTARSLSKQK